MNAWRLLLTRPAEESAALAAELAEVGIHSSSLPLIDIQPLALSPAQLAPLRQLARYCAIIVVSKPAARLATALLGAATPPQPWFAVGAATGAILQQHGLPTAWPLHGEDSEAVLALPALQAAIQVPAARVLIVRGEGGREALAEALRAQGVQVDYLQLYRRVLPAYARGTLAAQVQAERLNALVVSSGQGFEHLYQLAGEQWPTLASLALFVPSQRVAELARQAGAMNVVDCRGASAAALLTALRDYRVPTPMQRMDT